MLRPAFKKLLDGEEQPSKHHGNSLADSDTNNSTNLTQTDADPDLGLQKAEKDVKRDPKDSLSTFMKAEYLDDDAIEWDSDRHIYELQLNQLQEQLVAAIIENQNLGDEVKQLKSKDVEKLLHECQELKKHNAKLTAELGKLTSKDKLRPLRSTIESQPLQDNDPSFQNWEKVEHVADKADEGKDLRDEESDGPSVASADGVKSIKASLLEIMYDRLADFDNDDDDDQDDELHDQPLSIKKLKENVTRFSDALTPFQENIAKWRDIIMWKNPFFTLSVAMIYMYSAWYGLLLPLLLSYVILYLTRTYLVSRGIIQQRSSDSLDGQEAEKQKDDIPTSWSGRYQLVLSIAKKVQNRLGHLADALEKLQSLVSWQHMEATQKLWTYLVIGCVASLILSGQSVLHVVGLLLGVKIFVITPVYSKFPKVKTRYDDVARLWEELPTRADHQLKQLRQADAQISDNAAGEVLAEGDPLEMDSPPSGSGPDWDTIVFCDRFGISRKETPLSGWADGRRCTLMNKDKPLANMKHGRLYLTKHHLCFERNQFNSQKNIALKLEDIVSIVKTKPFSILPGSGMAIEVKVKLADKPYIFAAMVNRDEAYEGIIRAARSLSLPWASQ